MDTKSKNIYNYDFFLWLKIKILVILLLEHIWAFENSSKKFDSLNIKTINNILRRKNLYIAWITKSTILNNDHLRKPLNNKSTCSTPKGKPTHVNFLSSLIFSFSGSETNENNMNFKCESRIEILYKILLSSVGPDYWVARMSSCYPTFFL